MKRLGRLLYAITERQILQVVTWRAFLVTLVVNQAVTPLLGLAVWSAALPGRPAVTTYYVALLLVQLVTVSYEQHTFSNGIYDGSLADLLLRPHPVVLEVLGMNAALRLLHLVIGLPLLALTALAVGVSLETSWVLAALPALALAAVLRFLYTYTLALSGFWTQRAHGVVGLGETLIFLLGGSAAPISLLPEPLRDVGAALPFRAMLGFPTEIAAGHLAWGDVLAGYTWQMLWAASLTALAVVVWRTGVRRYAAVGG